MFECQVESSEQLNLLYDVIRHYHVIAMLTGAMAKLYVCNACSKGCIHDATHMIRCDPHLNVDGFCVGTQTVFLAWSHVLAIP
jgi:hypothetical protein